MESEVSKKLFIFIGLLFLFLMLGPYFGVHPFGAPELPKRPESIGARNVFVAPDDQEDLDSLPQVTVDGEIIENQEELPDTEDLLFQDESP